VVAQTALRVPSRLEGQERRPDLSEGSIVVVSLDSVESIPRAHWERMLRDEPESWDFYVAAERSPPAGFTLEVLAAFHGDELLGVAPLFSTAYRIDTALQGSARRVSDWVYARRPGLLSLPVLGIGSPLSDNCALGFAPELTQDECALVFDAMLRELASLAKARGSKLIAVKSLDRSAEVLGPTLHKHGYAGVTSVPLVMLELPYRTLDQYLDALPRKTGAYLRRKLRAGDKVRFEERTTVEGMESQILELFQNTLGQSKVDYGEFQQLGSDYFAHVLSAMGDKAQFMLCWQQNNLVGFQLALVGRDRLLAKQIGMKYPEARELNLYFLCWVKLIEYAIANNIRTIEMGATTYATKLLFGGYLERRWLHFRFRRPLVNRLLGRLGRFLDFENNDTELKALDPAVKTNMGPRTSRLGRRSGPHIHG
jgi:predicted N-acyltransferase